MVKKVIVYISLIYLALLLSFARGGSYYLFNQQQQLQEEGCFIKRRIDCSGKPYVTFVRNSWLSSAVNIQVISILLEEKLGVCVKVKDLSTKEGIELLAKDEGPEPKIIMEYWYKTRAVEFEEYVLKTKSVNDLGKLGVEGQIGWFIVEHMFTETNYGLDAYPSYKDSNVAAYLSTNTTFPNGRLLSAAKSWSSFDSQIIKNLGLKLTVEFAPEENTEDYIISQVDEAVANKKPIIFYFWTPHQLFAKHNLIKVYLPKATKACHSPETIGKEGVNCDYDAEDLLKLGSKSLENLPSTKYLVSKFSYRDIDQIKIMGQVAYGNRTLFNASCEWLKENEIIWKDWVSDTSSTSSRTLISLFSSLGGVIVLIVVLSILFFSIYKYRDSKERKKALRNAPKEPPLTIMFTDIQNSTKLWNGLGKKMEKILQVHNEIIRKNIEIYHGYEVKTQGDSFMVAFANPLQALLCATKIQKDLLLGDWSEELVNEKGPDDLKTVTWNSKFIYRGPRVRMGLHHGKDLEVKFDPTTKRIDYFGNDVNMSSRVEGTAIGGRIVVSADFVKAIRAHITRNTIGKIVDKNRIRFEKEEIEFSVLGKFELKGLYGLFTIFWVKDLNFTRTNYIEQFENPQALRETLAEDLSFPKDNSSINYEKKYPYNAVVPLVQSVTMNDYLVDEDLSLDGDSSYGTKRLLNNYLENPNLIDEQDKSLLFHKLLFWKPANSSFNHSLVDPQEDSEVVVHGEPSHSYAGLFDKLLLVASSFVEQVDQKKK
ncbi:hypothetical protein ABK040_015237 [Willaertia magna]